MSNHKFTVPLRRPRLLRLAAGTRISRRIQGAIEKALSRVFECPLTILGSGRTDRGAHAEGQVFNADLPGDLDLDLDLDLEAKRQAINAALPPSIQILAIEPVGDEFHARTSARGKTYRYEIWNAPECPDGMKGRVWHIPAPLAIEPMRLACGEFVGERDFASFGTKPNFKQKSTRRNLKRVSLTHEDERISIVFEADGFLYKMVRNIVRAIVKVGEGRTRPEDLRTMIEACDRKGRTGHRARIRVVSRRGSIRLTAIAPEVVEKVLHLRRTYHLGPIRIVWYMERYPRHSDLRRERLAHLPTPWDESPPRPRRPACRPHASGRSRSTPGTRRRTRSTSWTT